MKDFRKLTVWQKAHELILQIYQASRGFPRDEIYGLRSQIRRAAASIATNVAEGCGRNTDGDLRRFVDMAAGSASELEYLLLLSNDLGFMSPDMADELAGNTIEVKRMLYAFSARLRTSHRKSRAVAES